MPTIDNLIDELGQLPEDWTSTGSVGPETLRAIAKYVGEAGVAHSAETGSGKTTILFSHLSRDHKVFALNDYEGSDTNSIAGVRVSPLFNPETVEFIEGPSQLTLPQFKFPHKLQVAMIDGPHAYPFPDMEYYYFYPQLELGGLLIIDDIHIPTIRRMFEFLQEDEMFTLLEVVTKTAFFRRSTVPTFSPILDGWWLQKYNKARFPIQDTKVTPTRPSLTRTVKDSIPRPLKRTIKKLQGKT